MKMQDISGKMVKIGRTSITVKDGRNKTRGIVRDVLSYSEWPERECFAYHKALDQSGIWSSSLEVIKNVVLDRNENKIFYLNNLSRLEQYEKYFVGREGFEVEKNNYKKLKEIAEKAAGFMEVVDCYII